MTCESEVAALRRKFAAMERRLERAGELVGEMLDAIEVTDGGDFDGFAFADEWRDHLGGVLDLPDGHYACL